MKFVSIWIQWSGKWTQARILVDKYDFKLYETWTTLRDMAKQDNKLWKLIKSTIESWHQVNPEIVEDILKDILQKNPDWNIIFDWFVRNEWNKNTFDRIVWDYKVVFFDLPEQEAKNRLLWRMYDKETGETFSAWTLINPKNWNTLVKRADDEEMAIQKRIDLFFDVTMPIVEEYKKQWNLIEINANQSIENVSDELINKLGL